MKEVQTWLCSAEASVEVHTSFLPVTPPAGLQQVTQGHPSLPGAPGLNFSSMHHLLLFTEVFRWLGFSRTTAIPPSVHPKHQRKLSDFSSVQQQLLKFLFRRPRC